VKKTGGISSKKDIGRGKFGFYFLDPFHDIVTLVMPVEIEGNDSRGLFAKIVENGELAILNPFQSQVDDLGRDVMSCETIS